MKKILILLLILGCKEQVQYQSSGSDALSSSRTLVSDISWNIIRVKPFVKNAGIQNIDKIADDTDQLTKNFRDIQVSEKALLADNDELRQQRVLMTTKYNAIQDKLTDKIKEYNAMIVGPRGILYLKILIILWILAGLAARVLTVLDKYPSIRNFIIKALPFAQIFTMWL